MSQNSTSITTTAYTNPLVLKMQENPLFQVVDTYLDTVETLKGHKPSLVKRENFILTCLTNKLNPIKKQIYLIGYDSYNGSTFSEVISISGQTAIAARTGEYAGVSQPRFTYKDNRIDSCSVTVYRLVKGQKCEFTGQAYFDERVGTKKDGSYTKEWLKQPRTLIEKCARAIALRNAFPEELGNYYEEAEMNFTDDTTKSDNSEQKKYITEDQKVELDRLLKEASKVSNKSADEIIQNILTAFNFPSIDDVYEPYATKIIEAVKKRINEYKEAEKELEEFETED